jgi:hypothetical protein
MGHSSPSEYAFCDHLCQRQFNRVVDMLATGAPPDMIGAKPGDWVYEQAMKEISARRVRDFTRRLAGKRIFGDTASAARAGGQAVFFVLGLRRCTVPALTCGMAAEVIASRREVAAPVRAMRTSARQEQV